MKKILMTFLLGSFMATGIALAQTPPPTTVVVKTPVVVRGGGHPEVHKAMRDLRLAKDHLEKAAHEYGGHRVKAIEAIDHAMVELKECMGFND